MHRSLSRCRRARTARTAIGSRRTDRMDSFGFCSAGVSAWRHVSRQLGVRIRHLLQRLIDRQLKGTFVPPRVFRWHGRRILAPFPCAVPPAPWSLSGRSGRVRWRGPEAAEHHPATGSSPPARPSGRPGSPTKGDDLGRELQFLRRGGTVVIQHVLRQRSVRSSGRRRAIDEKRHQAAIGLLAQALQGIGANGLASVMASRSSSFVRHLSTSGCKPNARKKRPAQVPAVCRIVAPATGPEDQTTHDLADAARRLRRSATSSCNRAPAFRPLGCPGKPTARCPRPATTSSSIPPAMARSIRTWSG